MTTKTTNRRRVVRGTGGGTAMRNATQQQRLNPQSCDPQLRQIWRNMRTFATKEGLSNAAATRVATNWVAQVRGDLQQSRS